MSYTHPGEITTELLLNLFQGIRVVCKTSEVITDYGIIDIIDDTGGRQFPMRFKRRLTTQDAALMHQSEDPTLNTEAGIPDISSGVLVI